MNKNARVIYKKVTNNFKKKGYINLDHRLVNSLDELVDIATIFRNPAYETFRVIYMKDNHIVGYESISSKTPISVPLFRDRRINYTNNEKGFYKVKNRMKRLSANGYYMVHNHPSGNAKASSEDIRTTKEFIKQINGFKGHLIMGTDQYSWIEKDESFINGVRIDDYQPINFKKADKFSKMMNKKSVFDVKISSRTELVNFIHHINTSKDFSIAILTDSMNKVRMILDVPNSMLNQQRENLNGFFRNLAKTSGSSKVLFATKDKETFTKSLEHLSQGTFMDSICYEEVENNKIKLIVANEEIPSKELFEKEQHTNGIPLINIGGMIMNNNKLIFQDTGTLEYDNLKENYIEIPTKDFPKEEYLDREDTREPKEDEIRVLFKRVGKDPIIKVIPNTLEAKQKLINGLIEVVPYDEETLLVCNDEGKILGMKPNLLFDYDYIAGDCFLIGDDYENGDFKSLTTEQVKRIKEELKSHSLIFPNQKEYPQQEEREKEL